MGSRLARKVYFLVLLLVACSGMLSANAPAERDTTPSLSVFEPLVWPGESYGSVQTAASSIPGETSASEVEASTSPAIPTTRPLAAADLDRPTGTFPADSSAASNFYVPTATPPIGPLATANVNVATATPAVDAVGVPPKQLAATPGSLLSPASRGGAGTPSAGASSWQSGLRATSVAATATATPSPASEVTCPQSEENCGKVGTAPGQTVCVVGTSVCNDVVTSRVGLRAAFYYAWYPEQWTAAGHRYTSTLGEYSSSSTGVIDEHIAQMKHASIDAGIYSWWGQASASNQRFLSYLNRATTVGFKWAIYYEMDQVNNRGVADLEADIAYLAERYFDHGSYLKVAGRPVVFVYAPGGSCAGAQKWKGVRDKFGIYVSMTDVSDWWTCNLMDSWHGYRPERRGYSVYYDNHVYSIAVSAGFWSAAEATPRLTRDFATWETTVKAMVAYAPDWQLVYFNEYGEGTNIEPSDARCDVAQCFDYLNTLRNIR